MAIPPSGKTEMIAANRARAAANRETRNGEKQTETKDNKTNTNKADRNLRYPYAMLDSNTDYLRIDIATYSPPDLNLSDKDKGAVVETGKIDPDTKKEIVTINKNFSLDTGSNVNKNIIKQAKHTIILPIPQQLSDTSAISWGDAGLNALEAFGVSVTQGVMTQGAEGIEQALSALKGNANVLLSEDVRKAVAAALSGEAIGLIGGNVSGSQLVSRATGQVFNPNLELLFEGVNIRSFPFSFEFFPRNPKEADQVKRIIRTFKKSMSARKTGTADIFIKAPDVFQLTFMKGGSKHPFLNRFLPMALTNMNLSYTGSNTYSTFYDGTPTHMKLDLTFKELNPIYFEDYEALEQAKDTSVGY
jgi:hypothetical protein